MTSALASLAIPLARGYHDQRLARAQHARVDVRLELIALLRETASRERDRAELTQLANAFPGDLPLQVRVGRSLLEAGYADEAAALYRQVTRRFAAPGSAVRSPSPGNRPTTLADTMDMPTVSSSRVVAVAALTVAFMAPTTANAVECEMHRTTCALLRSAPIIFVGTLLSVSAGPEYHFRVDQRFRGAKRPSVDVLDMGFTGGSDSSGVGQRYLVFADIVPLDDGTEQAYWNCDRDMTPLEDAQPRLAQLRRDRAGMRVSSVYGSLVTHEDDGRRLLPRVALTFRSKSAAFHVTTDSRGTYAIDDLPPGAYQVFADLPPELELGQRILDSPPPPVEIEPDMCLEHEFVAVPGGRIGGRVLGPDGAPRSAVTVRLFKADHYRAGAPGEYAVQADGKPYAFVRLMPGDYVVLFDADQDADTKNPFPTTFYPSASHVKDATVIHLGAGQRVSNVDLRLPSPVPTRKLRVALEWNGHDKSLYKLFMYPGRLVAPEAAPAEEGTFDVELVTSATYPIKGHATCKSHPSIHLETETVEVDGSDPSVSQVMLTFRAGGGCPEERR